MTTLWQRLRTADLRGKEMPPKKPALSGAGFWAAVEYIADCHNMWSAVRDNGRDMPFL